ncbi:non-heme iron oxygenase ferredoxin subunit [Roseomonas sp. CCTCC AB2023176]|uniref:non-heme iron oxygenase ferredoxin subunit n=1 Tax=Roseomonas sp. CCTCC AB2023176 TaxID=3342640 RepID=UPI0035DC23AF
MTRFVRAAALAELQGADGVLAANVEGRSLALYLVDGEVFATDDLCTHGAARLSEGYLDGDLIECPLHQGLFNVRDGSPAGAPCTVPVKSYTAKVEGGEILIGIEE